MAVLVVTAAVTATAAGCRDPGPQPPKTAVAADDPLTTARQAMARGDYGGAFVLLRSVVVNRPADLEARYRLGVSASRLDQFDDAGREFEWVVRHGDPSAPEVQIARDWLAARSSAGVPPPTTAGRDAAPDPKPDPKPDLATVSGRVADAEGAKSRLQLFLKGLPETTVKDEYHLLRTDEAGNFRFTNVVPGDYLLTNAIAGPATWRLKISLGRGERRRLDLSAANDTSVRDDFRESR